MPQKILCLAPVLPADVLATAKILEQHGLLDRLVTRGAWSKAGIGHLVQTLTIMRPLSRRPSSPVASERTEVRWSADLIFYLALAITRSRTRATDMSFAFLDNLTKDYIKSSLGAVFAREDCCLRTFRRAKEAGVVTIYQLPTAYWRLVQELMNQEIQQFPQICRAASNKHEFAAARTERKEAELEFTDYILCPSSFVQRSLERYRPGHYEPIPFGIDKYEAPSIKATARKPVFLYAGNITMRKGIHRLLIAWKKLAAYRTHELRLVGDVFLSEKFLDDFRGMFTHVPRVARSELDRHYAEASAFVFNPVADGFGHVILEAMRAGLPVIASKNSGAPDTIDDRVEGLLVDYGDEQQLMNALDWALSHPTALSGLGIAAAERADKWRWNHYAERFLRWLRPLLKHE